MKNMKSYKKEKPEEIKENYIYGKNFKPETNT